MLWNFSNKLSWQINQSSQLSHFYILQFKKNGHRASTTQFVETGATVANTKYPQLNQVKWTNTRSSKMVFDVSGSLNRVDDYQPWPKEGDSANCTAAADREGCFDGLIAGSDVGTNTLLRILPTYRDLPEHARVHPGQRQLLHLVARHQGRLSDSTTPGTRCCISRRPACAPCTGLACPEQVNTYNTPARSIPENIQQGSVHTGQVAAEPQAHGECRCAPGYQLRLDQSALPGGHAVRRGAVLRQDDRHTRLEGREPEVVGGVRHRRRRPHGAEVRRQPLHHSGRQQRARSRQSHLPRQRHPAPGRVVRRDRRAAAI